MSTATNLQGGLGNSRDNGAVLEEARKKLIVRKEIDLQRLLKRPAVKIEGRMASAELAKYVDDLADGAFEFVFGVARPFIRELDKDVAEIGEEVKCEPCEDGDDETRQHRAEEYESTIPIFADFVPENDKILREEADISGRRQFVEALCLRVQTRAKIGLLADDIRGAEGKDYLEHLLEESKDNAGKRVFVKSSAKNAPIRAFGRGYDLTDGVFGERHHEFASKKLTEVVNSRARELATAFNAEREKRKHKVSVENDDLVSPEELLFKDSDGTAVLPWKFQGHDNAVKLRRSGARLYVVDAVGSPLFALEEMRKEHKEPFVILRHILEKDGEHLCFGEMIDGRPRYKFTEIVSRSAFAMTLWVRTAAGANCPNRLLPGDQTRVMFKEAVANGKKPNGNGNNSGKKRPVKAAGELLTDKEFLYYHGLGDYELVYDKGFRYEPRDENDKPTGTMFEITTAATALVERKKDVDGKDKIALRSVSSDELGQLLLAGGAEPEHEFFEGERGANLPVSLRLGISQAFARLKKSEG